MANRTMPPTTSTATAINTDNRATDVNLRAFSGIRPFKSSNGLDVTNKTNEIAAIVAMGASRRKIPANKVANINKIIMIDMSALSNNFMYS